MFQLAAVADHVPAPAGLRSNTTEATPEPPASAELLVSAIGGTPISAPFAGAVTVPVGRVLSTRMVIAAEVKALPALSVVVTRRSYWPSGTVVVSKLAAWFVQVPAPAGERWNWTVATPDAEPPQACRRSCW